MSGIAISEVVERLKLVEDSYHRLLLLVGDTNAGKTDPLLTLANATGAPIININLELSRRMLELTKRQRALRAQELMKEIIANVSGEIVILNKIELLYEPQLELDPLKLLQDLSRNRTIVAVWSGSVKGNRLTYAEPGHAEYRQYPIRDLQIVDLDLPR